MKNIVSDLGTIVAEIYKERLLESLQKNEDISVMIMEIEGYLHSIGREAVREILETANSCVKESSERIKNWEIQASSLPNTLNTIFGSVSYERAYYKNKSTGEYRFLSDEALGIEATDKTTLCLMSRNIDEATDISYRRSGKKASRAIQTSGQTVMNHIRKLGAISNDAAPIKLGPGRIIKTLYIEADEDHTASQTERAMEPPLVYIHEGSEAVTKGRFRLKNVRYFSGMHKDNEELWQDVIDYIDTVYDYGSIEKIYVSGDGASWIKNGAAYVNKGVYVLDKYHLIKYVRQAAAHIPGGIEILLGAIYGRDREYFEICIETIKDQTEPGTKRFAIEDAKRYILNNWDSLDNYNNIDYIGCSAEGHVSHILSDRLSSRPMAWGKEGADQMARLRVFKANGGVIHQLLLEKKYAEKLEKAQIRIDADIKRLRRTGTSNELVHNITVLNVGKGTQLEKILKSLRGY